LSKASKFIKSSATYFIGNVLTKLIAFFLLPLYTSKISATEMGYFNTSVNYLNIVIPVICLEIWSAIMRYMFDFGEAEDRYKSMYNGLTIFAGSFVLYTLIFVVLSIIMSIDCLWLIYFYGVFTMLQNIYTYSARGLGYNTTFAVSGLVGSLVNCLSNIFMILVLHMTLESLYIAMIIGLAVQCIIMESKVRLLARLGDFHADKEIVSSMIKFSLPLAFNSACFWFLSGYNAVAITGTLGLEQNGIYTVAGKFTMALSLVSTCFTLAWQELVFSMGNEKDDKSYFYTKASDYYIKFLFAGLLALIPFVKIVFPYMVIDEVYQPAFALVPLYLFATVASIYCNFLGNIFSAEKNTKIVFYSTFAAAIVNVILFHSLIYKIGPQAANISLLSGFLVNIILRIIILGKHVTIKLNYGIIIGGSILFAVGFYVYMTMNVLANCIFFVLVCVLALYVLRELLSKLLNAVKKKRA